MLIKQICRVWLGKCYPTPDDGILIDFAGNPYSECYSEQTQEYYYADVSCKDTKIELSTGKKDKKNKLIFQGDLLSLTDIDCEAEVVFNDSAFWLKIGESLELLFDYNSEDLEIIGNINEQRDRKVQ